jgi:orotidine-5'-phosphate decarboxylase
VTLNPYMGFDSVEPFLSNPEKGVFILALTSNSGSKDFQRLKVGVKPLYEKVVHSAKKWNKKQNIGLVVGATHPTELKRIRKIVPDMPILIPGIGKQGGELKAAIQYRLRQPSTARRHQCKPQHHLCLSRRRFCESSTT